MKMASNKKLSSAKNQGEITVKGEGAFNFPNGDSYEGEYIIMNNEIYRHGYGVYRTKNLDEYWALWNKDCISLKLHIVYGNKAEYSGEIDEKGAMNGKGTYVFPDGTSLSATWIDNEPTADFVYNDPLHYTWYGKLSFNKQDAIFSPENNIWK